MPPKNAVVATTTPAPYYKMELSLRGVDDKSHRVTTPALCQQVTSALTALGWTRSGYCEYTTNIPLKGPLDVAMVEDQAIDAVHSVVSEFTEVVKAEVASNCSRIVLK